MVRQTVDNLKKNSLFLILVLLISSFFIKDSFAQTKVAFGTFLVTATITSKCETSASEPEFVDDNFQSINIVSDVTVVCNNDSKPVIKIISRNIKELFNNNNYAFQFKKNNGDLIGFTSDTLLARLKANPSSMLDFEEESFTLKNTFSGKIKKANFDSPKFPNGKIENANYPNLQRNPIIFEISY
jgi:hypothetical protein